MLFSVNNKLPETKQLKMNMVVTCLYFICAFNGNISLIQSSNLTLIFHVILRLEIRNDIMHGYTMVCGGYVDSLTLICFPSGLEILKIPSSDDRKNVEKLEKCWLIEIET